MDLLFLFDICLNFFITFVADGARVTDSVSIAMKYITTWCAPPPPFRIVPGPPSDQNRLYHFAIAPLSRVLPLELPYAACLA